MESTAPSTAAWRIDDLPDGWALEVQFRVPLKRLLPRYIRRNVPIFVVQMSIFSVLALSVAWLAAGGELGFFLLFVPVAIFAALVLTAVCWPIRFGRMGAPSQDYYLRYFRANRHQTVRASHVSIDVPVGVFALERLSSLRVSEMDSVLGLYGLDFDGEFIGAQLFDWPGVSAEDATGMRQALLERLAT